MTINVGQEEELVLCEWEHCVKPPSGHTLSCVREAGHDGRHYPFATWSGGFTIYEFDKRSGEMSVVMQAETKGKLTREEIGTVYAYMVYVNERRHRRVDI